MPLPMEEEEEEAMEIPASPEETPLYVLEFDPDYEFDAARFFDFTLPESPSDEEEAERWFDRAPSYPPSPFISKLCRGGVPLSLDNVMKAPDLESQHGQRPINNDAVTEEAVEVSGINPYHDVADQDPPPRAAANLRSHSYMKPTASYLAKQNQDQELRFHRILRSRNVVEDHKTSSNSSSSNEIQATKRQKLDVGYLQKIIHSKRRSPLQHKVAKMYQERKVDDCILGRPKVTIPREFFLETARRAMRHRAKNENISSGQITSNFRTSKAYGLNQDLKIPAAKHPLPVELLKNLSIDSEVRSSYQSMSHVSTVDTKLNMQRVLQQGHEQRMLETAMEKPLRSSAKQFQCRRDMNISDHRRRSNFNRGLDIR